MDSSLKSFRSLTPCESHLIRGLEFSSTGDKLLVISGSSQVSLNLIFFVQISILKRVSKNILKSANWQEKLWRFFTKISQLCFISTLQIFRSEKIDDFNPRTTRKNFSVV